MTTGAPREKRARLWDSAAAHDQDDAPGPPADVLTLALAETEMLTLTDALAAPATWEVQATASAPRDPPADTTVVPAWTASGPCD